MRRDGFPSYHRYNLNPTHVETRLIYTYLIQHHYKVTRADHGTTVRSCGALRVRSSRHESVVSQAPITAQLSHSFIPYRARCASARPQQLHTTTELVACSSAAALHHRTAVLSHRTTAITAITILSHQLRGCSLSTAFLQHLEAVSGPRRHNYSVPAWAQLSDHLLEHSLWTARLQLFAPAWAQTALYTPPGAAPPATEQ